nr:MAG TPA: hypothetical protein [Caudoviricetes sp.]
MFSTCYHFLLSSVSVPHTTSPPPSFLRRPGPHILPQSRRNIPGPCCILSLPGAAMLPLQIPAR